MSRGAETHCSASVHASMCEHTSTCTPYSVRVQVSTYCVSRDTETSASSLSVPAKKRHRRLIPVLSSAYSFYGERHSVRSRRYIYVVHCGRTRVDRCCEHCGLRASRGGPRVEASSKDAFRAVRNTRTDAVPAIEVCLKDPMEDALRLGCMK